MKETRTRKAAPLRMSGDPRARSLRSITCLDWIAMVAQMGYHPYEREGMCKCWRRKLVQQKSWGWRLVSCVAGADVFGSFNLGSGGKWLVIMWLQIQEGGEAVAFESSIHIRVPHRQVKVFIAHSQDQNDDYSFPTEIPSYKDNRHDSTFHIQLE